MLATEARFLARRCCFFIIRTVLKKVRPTSEVRKKKWVTQATFDQFQSELDERSGSTHAEITRKIDPARREGDLKENGGYHVVRDEQAHNEIRILELQETLKHAEVDEATDDSTISPGYAVEVRVGKHKIHLLLGSHVADEGMGIDVFPSDAPLGATLPGHREGGQVKYLVPTGKKIQVEVSSVSIFEG